MQFNHLRRRKFIVALGSAAAWPRAGRAQQGERVRRVSVIMGFAEADPVWQAYLATFRQRLQEFGWTVGRNVRFDYRFTGESAARMRSAAAEVVAMAPDVIFVSTNPVVSAVLEETRSIPIVFTWVSDSVGSGYMSNLAHPGGNITGFHNSCVLAKHPAPRLEYRYQVPVCATRPISNACLQTLRRNPMAA